ncbi:ROK family transcriptional regulator [Alicyclobacillus sp. SO9]|uniref:ROK family transcriptional regulator n=1 Tax=Alicyclobacillus sp. SO9 TaxID=2665646 RepID=UPI0018E8C67F|nr:ROK family transcriptional regulator [Alicyclobacillus sp. SO9]QQE77885.1 ROK family transcriptional regulator [Alicyclobacillus sp. SO9]
MIRTGDQRFIKELNKSITINLIRRKSPISRSQISVESGLNKATVSSLIDELIADGLVVELGPGHSSVGRRPVMLGFNGTAGYTIGVELGIDYVRALTTDLAGNVVLSEETGAPSSTNVQDVVAALASLIQRISSRTPSSSLGIIGVGIGVPGLVDFTNGMVLNAPNLGWANVPLKSYLETHLDIPIYIDNEANTGALAEHMFGRGKQISNFVYLSIATGIGTGIIINGNLVRGSEGTAGEFGHMVLETQGLRCSCGNRGCLEMYASEKALVAKYQQISGESLPTHDILARLAQGDAFAFQAIQAIAQYLGVGINNIVNALNPDLVLIGNRMSAAGNWLIPQIEQIVGRASLRTPPSRVKVEVASLGRDATAVGAGALVINEYFAGPIQ